MSTRSENGAAAMAAPASDHREAFFAGARGTRLFFQAWEPAQPRAVVLLLHGQGEHSGRYASLAADLVGQGISLYAMDHRGHGRSEGPRGHLRRFEEILQDVDRFRVTVTSTFAAPVPVFLMGHSFGGLVALRYLQTRGGADFHGAILSSPLLGLAVRAPAWKKLLGRGLTRVLPALSFATELDAEHLSRDPAVASAYREDPLVHGLVTPRFYTEMVAAMARARAEGEQLRLPLLFLVAGSDRIVRGDLAVELARSLPGEVELRVYDSLYHECLNAPERDRVVRDLLAWIDARLA